MGYTITIGEYVQEIHDEGDVSEVFLFKGAEGIPNPDNILNAPRNSMMWLDYSSSFSPSYSSMSRFCREVGVPLESAIGEPHPGVIGITEEYCLMWEAARARHVEKHGALSNEEDPAYWDQVRLIWFCFWSRYALKHCERPVVGNT